MGDPGKHVYSFSAFKYPRALPPLFSSPNKINNLSISSNHHPYFLTRKAKKQISV